jgi:hypothetical protein
VIAGRGVATRQYDGVCVLFDEDLDPGQPALNPDLAGWWVRVKVKDSSSPPPRWVPADGPDEAGWTPGWRPAWLTRWSPFLLAAVHRLPRSQRQMPGTHELIGPRVNGNPEKVDHHLVIPHRDADPLNAPRDYESLTSWLPGQTWEGVVWHWLQPDGSTRMAKVKRRDLRR